MCHSMVNIQSPTAEIRRGKKKKKKKKEERKKKQDENMMVCPITQGDHNNLSPGLVTSYDLQPGNGAGLFSKEKVSKEADK